MRILKNVFKPILAVVVFPVAGVLSLCEKAIVAFRIKAQYKNIDKLKIAKRKLYSLVFNPYRICNGIRPNIICYKPSAFDVEQCHNYFHTKKKFTSECR